MRRAVVVWIGLFPLAISAIADNSPCTQIERGTPKRGRMGQTPDYFAAENSSLIQIIAYAFEIQDPLFVIGPDWISHERVKVECDGPEARPALRQALQEQFDLVADRYQRPMKVWVMRRPGYAKPLAAADLLDPVNHRRSRANPSFAEIIGGWSMEEIAKWLQFILQTPVLDETDFGGSYRISLTFNPADPHRMIQAFREELGVELIEEYPQS